MRSLYYFIYPIPLISSSHIFHPYTKSLGNFLLSSELRMMKILILTLIWIALVCRRCFASEQGESRPYFRPYTDPFTPDAFFEQFAYDDLKDSKWKPSHYSDSQGTQYDGTWSIEGSLKNQGFVDDKGLVMKTPAAHHAISYRFEKPFVNDHQDLVLQYEIKLQDGLDCGGAYIKLLGEDFEDEFSKHTKFLLMFGPDQCGMEDKIHLILNRYNPVAKKYEEHHLRTPPMSRGGHFSNLYTLILHKNQKFEIRINGEIAKAGSLLDENKFTPPFEPPKEIIDTSAKKPEDWDDRKYIPDPHHPPKPENYDELYGSPRIPDPNAVKPEDWNESISPMIPDPEASIPEDWNESVDGKWIPPLVANPDCTNGQCGPWSPPSILNPNFKGRWNPPMIENPNYQGPWTPGYIPNPNYYKDERPADMEPIGGIGFELWTMSPNILFDNIYLGHSIEEAEHIGNTTFLMKQELEGKYFAPPIIGEEPLAPPKEIDSYLDDDDEFSFTAIVKAIQTILIEQVYEARSVYEEFSRRPYGVIREKPMECLIYSCTFLSLFTFVFGLISAIGFMISSSPVANKESNKVEEEEKKKEERSKEEETKDIPVSTGAKRSSTSTRRRK